MKEILLGESENQKTIEKIKEKFSIAKCREVLERKGKKFTDEQILLVREFLMKLSNIAYQTFQKQIQRELDFEMENNRDNIVQLNQDSKGIEIKKAA